MTISDVSALGRLTREAMVVESVSTIILEYKGTRVSETSGVKQVHRVCTSKTVVTRGTEWYGGN